MSNLNRILVVALVALSGVAANAASVEPSSRFAARSVIASHEAVPTLTAVAHHVRHRHHHRRHHHQQVRAARHVR